MSKHATPLRSTTGRSGRIGAAGSTHPRFAIVADPIPNWREAKASLERWMLVEALTRSRGNMAAASRLLGITKVAVLHAVRRHKLGSYTKAHDA